MRNHRFFAAMLERRQKKRPPPKKRPPWSWILRLALWVSFFVIPRVWKAFETLKKWLDDFNA